MLVLVWCELLQFVLASKALPRFTAAENLILCNLGQWCQLSTSRCLGMVCPGCTAQGETPSEHDPEGALVQHKQQGARSSNPGRYRLFPAAILECLCITAPAERALGCLVYLGANPHLILPLHHAVPGLISLPETDAQERAVTSLEQGRVTMSKSFQT